MIHKIKTTTIAVTYSDDQELIDQLKKAVQLIESGVKNKASDNFVIQTETSKFLCRLARTEEINGRPCTVIPSRLNFE